MAKKEPPQEYIEVLEVLNVLYDEWTVALFMIIFSPIIRSRGSSVVTMKSLMQFIFIPMKKTVGQGED